jgi:NADH-quinone oxidoreductase subunit E
MLTTEELQEIEAEMGHYPERRAAGIEGLKIVQRHRGWVCDEALRDVAGLVGMSPDELEGIATFYNLIFRRPVGRHVVLLCASVSCWMLGEEALRARLRERLGIAPGETSADGRFTLLPIQCLGACDRAPALMVGRDLHTDVDAAGLDRVLERYP